MHFIKIHENWVLFKITIAFSVDKVTHQFNHFSLNYEMLFNSLRYEVHSSIFFFLQIFSYKINLLMIDSFKYWAKNKKLIFSFIKRYGP